MMAQKFNYIFECDFDKIDMSIKTADRDLFTSDDVTEEFLTSHYTKKFFNAKGTDATEAFYGIWANFLRRNTENIKRIDAALTSEYNPIENYDRTKEITLTTSGSDVVTDKGKTEQSGTTATTEGGKDSTTTESNTAQTGTQTSTEGGKDTTTANGNTTSETQRGITDTEKTYNFGYDSTTPIQNGQTEHEFGTGSDIEIIDNETTSDTTYGHTNDQTSEANTQATAKNDVTYGHTTDTTNSLTTDTDETHITEYGRTEKTSYITHGNIGVTSNQQMISSELELRRYDMLSDLIDRFADRYLFYSEGVNYGR